MDDAEAVHVLQAARKLVDPQVSKARVTQNCREARCETATVAKVHHHPQKLAVERSPRVNAGNEFGMKLLLQLGLDDCPSELVRKLALSMWHHDLDDTAFSGVTVSEREAKQPSATRQKSTIISDTVPAEMRPSKRAFADHLDPCVIRQQRALLARQQQRLVK